MTEIELRLVSRITTLFLQELKHAWSNVLDLDLSVEHVESNPQLVQIVPPNEVVVLISFELTLGDLRGMMNLCIPFNSLERIGTKLSSNSWITYGRRNPSAESTRQISSNLKGSIVELVVHLADTHITTGDLIGLRVGDVITTEKDIHTPISVSVEGVVKYHAKPGAFKGRKAVEIAEPVQPEPQPPEPRKPEPAKADGAKPPAAKPEAAKSQPAQPRPSRPRPKPNRPRPIRNRRQPMPSRPRPSRLANEPSRAQRAAALIPLGPRGDESAFAASGRAARFDLGSVR